MIQLRGLELWLRDPAEQPIRFAEGLGLEVRVTSVYRSTDQQQRLRSNFERCNALHLYPSDVSLTRGMSCKWPAAPVGESAHQYRLAWDSIVRDPARRFPQIDLDSWWAAVRRWFGWHVPTEDEIHAELPDWRGALSS